MVVYPARHRNLSVIYWLNEPAPLLITATAVEGTARLVFLSARQTANLRCQSRTSEARLRLQLLLRRKLQHFKPAFLPPMASGTLTNGYTNGDSIPHQKEKNLPGGGNWVVQKFGGTSVGKFALNIADIVQ